MMRVGSSIVLVSAVALVLAGCGTGGGASQGAQKFNETAIEKISEDRFSVTVTADNVDGYQLSRCVAAAYAESLRDAQGKRLFDVIERQGGKLTDTFRLVEGVRRQTTTGSQVFRLVNEGTHDGRDVISVDLQLAECEKSGLPVGVE
jgi:predicted small secreted protein